MKEKNIDFEPSEEYKKWYEKYSTEELDGDYIMYYYEEGMEKGMSEEEKASIKSLENTGVSREEYNRLLDKFHKINLEFNF